jgi:hypothetical protein
MLPLLDAPTMLPAVNGGLHDVSDWFSGRFSLTCHGVSMAEK